MKRAIVIYVDNCKKNLKQFYIFYQSYKYVNPANTDLVVFCDDWVIDLIPDDCVKCTCELCYTSHRLKTYPRLKSVDCFNGSHVNILKSYDYILHTDADTLITPAWNEFHSDQYTCGITYGGYFAKDIVKTELRRIAIDFNLNYTSDNRGISQTHYGPTSLIIKMCQLASFFVKHLRCEEFNEHSGKWPFWYDGVCVMYGRHIAVNHLISNINRINNQLDVTSTSHQSIYKIPHIHCYHTRAIYSKFDFEDGNYNNININTLNKTQVNEYCLYMAMSAYHKYIKDSKIS